MDFSPNLVLDLLLGPKLGVRDNFLRESRLLDLHGALALLGADEAALLAYQEPRLAGEHFHLLAT
jgi:hypothetical protein